MAWRVILERKARKSLARFPDKDREKLLGVIDHLAADPYAARNVKALQGRDQYRLRMGDYRIIYSLDKGQLTIFVIELSQRSGAYRQMD